MVDAISHLVELLSAERTLGAARAVLLIVAGLVLARLAGRLVASAVGDRIDTHVSQLLRRAVFYTVVVLFSISALREVGFKLQLLLGAAGILTVAVGFASQTSAANLVSGLFLIFERPFSVGDVMRVGTTTGEVLSIDLLSVKLRTFDNLFVRIPNETLVKSEITNLTRFPLRRVDLPIGVAYKEDLERVRETLFEVASRNPLSLEEPQPLFIVLGYGDSAINLQFSVWGLRQNFLDLRNSIQREIKEAFDHAGIEIPFPHRSLYAGSATEPLPVRLVETGMPAQSG
jgi:small-conductance mechanosensitive channel